RGHGWIASFSFLTSPKVLAPSSLAARSWSTGRPDEVSSVPYQQGRQPATASVSATTLVGFVALHTPSASGLPSHSISKDRLSPCAVGFVMVTEAFQSVFSLATI